MNQHDHATDGGPTVELVSFHLGDRWIGIDIHRVQEVIRLHDLTVVPHSPQAVRGMVGRRDEIITIVDLRRILGLGTTPINAGTRCVIVQSESERVGILVDRIGDVITATEASIAPATGNLEGPIAQYVDRVHETADALLCILDPDAALAAGMASPA